MKTNEERSFHAVRLQNVTVKFPFVPYEVQNDYMIRVIQSLQTRQNAVLESPTGTGKTLSLLCSSLAWLEQRFGGFAAFNANQDFCETAEAPQRSQILYASRTHSQLSQASKELKRTNYNRVKSVVIGSRDQLCLDTEVRSQPTSQAKRRSCNAKVAAHSCQYYDDYEKKVSARNYQDMNVLDIEDLLSLGETHKCCPYYASKVLRKQSEILFMPYNYLLERTTRKMQGISLENNVVIFDEAHNIEQCCEESRSFYVTSTDFAMAVKDLDYAVDLIRGGGMGMSDSELGFDVEAVAILKAIVCELESKFDSAFSRFGTTPLDGDFVTNCLAEVDISHQTERMLATLNEVITFIQSKNTAGTVWGSTGNGLQKMYDMISMACSCSSAQDLKNRFKAYFEELQNRHRAAKSGIFNSVNETRISWKLNFVCLTAGVAMSEIHNSGVHCIILTSGTLSPIDAFIAELETPFPIVLSNDHIIAKDASLVLALSSGPDSNQLLCTYTNRDNLDYIRSLGHTLLEICVRTPAGVLAFFPSYAALEAIYSRWDSMGITQRLQKHKTLIRETSSGDPRALIHSYMQAVDESKQGALLLTVCRGRFSEGFDFADSYARAVLIMGLPYAPKQDPRVRLKIDFLNSQPSRGLTGLRWYNTQAMRAVAQAVGRIIRHKDDFGVVVFCDKRFQDKGTREQLPSWVATRLIAPKDFRSAVNSVRDFFQLRGSVISLPKVPSSGSGLQKDDHQHRMGSNSAFTRDSVVRTTSSIFYDPSNNGGNSKKAPFSSGPEVKPEDPQSLVQDLLIRSAAFSSGSGASSARPKRPLQLSDALELPAKQLRPICSVPGMSISGPSSVSKVVIRARKPLEVDNGLYSKNLMENSLNRRKSASKPEAEKQPEREVKVSLQPTSVKERWIRLLADVKQSLNNPEKFAVFSRAVKTYKQDSKFECFAKQIAQVCRELRNRDDFIERVSIIVLSNDREKFVEICKSSFSIFQ